MRRINVSINIHFAFAIQIATIFRAAEVKKKKIGTD